MSEHTSISSQAQSVVAAPAAEVHEAVKNQNHNGKSINQLQYFSIQCKLSVGAVDDPLEAEADVMADKVMRMPEQSFIQRKCAHCEEEEKAQRKPIEPFVQRKCAACKEEETKAQRKPLASFIQRRETGNDYVANDTAANQIQSAKGNGSGMDTPTKSFMESRFGTDFSNVSIHTDRNASELSNALNAQAFTVGNDIYFNTGKYAPESFEGKHLLAHELIHTIQQADADHSTIQCKPKKQSATRRQVKKAGQMGKQEFLAALQSRLVAVCDAELKKVGRSALNCPYIFKTIAYYSKQPVADLLRLIQHFAHPPKNASAEQLIDAVVSRAREAARRLATADGQMVQAKTEHNNNTVLLSPDPSTVRSQIGEGRPFEGTVRNKMEQHFGTSFSAVSIHTDAAAASVNKQLGSRAFTVGSDIAFAEGKYNPATRAGDALIAHELAHTIQQDASSQHQPDKSNYDALEKQANAISESITTNDMNTAGAIQPGSTGLSIQMDGVGEVALAIALFAGEAGTEVAVTDGIVVVATDVAAPAVIESTAPAIIEATAPAVIETTAPAAIETVAPAAVETTASSSSVLSATAKVVGTGIAATTLSGDTSTEENDRRRRCQEMYPYALACEEEIGIEEQVIEFLIRNGYSYDSLGDCSGFSTHPPGVIDSCNGAPGESWHCNVYPYTDPIARVTKPGGVVSIFACQCCNAEGMLGFEWLGPHWSPGPGG